MKITKEALELLVEKLSSMFPSQKEYTINEMNKIETEIDLLIITKIIVEAFKK